MLFLLSQFFRNKDNVDKLAKFYFENISMLREIQHRFPDWECYVTKYLSAEVRAELRQRGVPL